MAAQSPMHHDTCDVAATLAIVVDAVFGDTPEEVPRVSQVFGEAAIWALAQRSTTIPPSVPVDDDVRQLTVVDVAAVKAALFQIYIPQ